MYRIRLAHEDDHETIVNFQIRMAKESEGLELDHATVTDGVYAVLRDPQKGKYLVAVDDNTVIASMMITYEWSDWRNQHIFWLQSVYVLPLYRGKKVFRQMYEHVRDMVKNDHETAGIRLYVDVSNKHAIAVYNAVGMDGQHYKTFEWMKNE